MRTITGVDVFKVPPRWIFVRLRADDGSVGWGESIVPRRSGAVVAAIGDMARNIEGADADRIEDLAQRLRRGAFFRGGPILATAAAGIETALWDLKARAHGLPVHEFLGGRTRDRIRAYAWIGGDSPADVVAHARTRVEEGFDAVKMNATPQMALLGNSAIVAALVERLGALRDAFGQGLDIALDLHGRVPRSALKPLLHEIEPFRPMWIEEATLPEHEESLVALARAAGSIPVATGERLCSRWDFKRVLESGAVDIVQPDVSITGLFEMEKIARLAEIYDVAVAPHCPNGPISLAASLQVGACCGNVAIQEQSLGLHYHQGYAGLPRAELLDYLTDVAPLTVTQGHFQIPAAPGLGIALDEAAIERRATDWHFPDTDWERPDGSFAEW